MRLRSSGGKLGQPLWVGRRQLESPVQSSERLHHCVARAQNLRVKAKVMVGIWVCAMESPYCTATRMTTTQARCLGGLGSLFPPVRNETLVIDPAPAVPIEFGGWSNGKWSEPVVMPVDRLDAEVTVMLPGK